MNKFNFYYFWDGETYIDAFNGCSGKIPDSYWQKVTFSDLTIILYPQYYGMYIGPPGARKDAPTPTDLGEYT